VYLFLNDVSGSEVLVILLFILIFFGSKSIPGIARTMGRTIRQIQDATNDIQTEIKKSTSEYKKDLNLEGIFKETAEEIRRPLDQMVDDVEHSVKYTPKPKTTIEVKPEEPIITESTTEVVDVTPTETTETNPNTEEKI